MPPMEFLTGFTTNVQHRESLLRKFSFQSMVRHLNSLIAAMLRCVILSPLFPITPSLHPLF